MEQDVAAEGTRVVDTQRPETATISSEEKKRDARLDKLPRDSCITSRYYDKINPNT